MCYSEKQTVTNLHLLLGVRVYRHWQKGFSEDLVGFGAQVLHSKEGLNVGLEIETWVERLDALRFAGGRGS